MQAQAQSRQKVGLIITIVLMVFLCCCLFAAMVLFGMGPVLGRVYSSIDASMALTPSPY